MGCLTPQVLVVGGGMITRDQILPSLLQLQRLGRVAGISVCASRAETVRRLGEAPEIRRAFPDQGFRVYPESGGPHPDLYRELLAGMPPRNLAVIALPDQLHHEAVMAALACDQHVCVVKPLALKRSHAQEIAREQYRRGLLVGVEYHKRFDDRSLMARQRYRAGLFGEFRLGAACLLEKWYYRHSNFQTWMTADNSDAFTYIGCHYVDLVHFITGLLPRAVSLYGIRDRFPNGNEGYLWTDARVIWSNGACLNVQNALGFADAAPGANTQGLVMYMSGRASGAWLAHSDQYRGLQYCYTRKGDEPGATMYAEPSPDYFQYLDLGGMGLVPAGYGFRSIEHIVEQAIRVEQQPTLAARQKLLREIDAQGILATPANSAYNEAVIEAGRISIQERGKLVEIETASTAPE